ncbi:MAG: DNA translocase FtsK [Candidatus Omnitrophota bacterium]|nr:MAG: DNA translocase FtsK [Candidatus Omnitrophota bacterium]
MSSISKDKIFALFLFALSFFTAISLFSFHPLDLPFFTSSPPLSPSNFGGKVGAYFAFLLLLSIGFSAYFLPLVFLCLGIEQRRKRSGSLVFLAGGIFIFLLSLSTILAGRGGIRGGGIVGLYLFSWISRYFNQSTYFIATVFLLLSFLLIQDIFFLSSFLILLKKIKAGIFKGAKKGGKVLIKLLFAKRSKLSVFRQEKKGRKKVMRRFAQKKEEKVREPSLCLREKGEGKKSLHQDTPSHFQLPPLSLLKSPPPFEQRKIREDLNENVRILEGTLLDFGIEAKVVNIDRGPAVTRYELLPAPGVKVNKIVSLGDNIAMALKAESVRFITPIPGKGAIGMEVPNSSTALVYCQEILNSEEFRRSKFVIPLGLGKDVSGMPLIADLAEMPHLLIAGTTGSGKTVCVNNLIINLLFKFSPDQLKLLIIDPKMVELAAFNEIPHLLSPAITEAKKAALALNWAVGEMERRFHLLAEAGARNIKVYNQKREEKLPYIVIVVDELADLMMIASKQVEGAITRLAQLSRAVGIHIILATQRPSVDVITGVIKANFPARISFKVASKVDSRTVLDVNGADKLLGNGDMLFLEPGSSRPKRAQGTLIFDEEIERVVNFLRKQQKPVYNEQILKQEEFRGEKRGGEKDELYEEAVRLVIQMRQASVSLLQRKLGIGYSRAARIIDMMEEEGIIGPPIGSKPRAVLIESKDLRE